MVTLVSYGDTDGWVAGNDRLDVAQVFDVQGSKAVEKESAYWRLVCSQTKR